MEQRYDVIIVGAGIAGLAHALEAVKRKLRVVVIEKDSYAAGASIRNFGLDWIIGQREGQDLERAYIGREVWLQLAAEAGFYCNPIGSVHIAHHTEELDVIDEFAKQGPYKGYQCQLLSAKEVKKKIPAINEELLLGGLFSPSELSIDPIEAIPAIARYLQQQGVEFCFGERVLNVDHPRVVTSLASYHADKIVLCTGADFEQFFPDSIPSDIVRCKLQMMALTAQADSFKMNTVFASGLSLAHYGSFGFCQSIPALKKLVSQQYPDFEQYGIHVLAVSNAKNEIILGDSHQYGNQPMPFEEQHINQLILDYAKKFLKIENQIVARSWTGVYPKCFESSSVISSPQPGVTMVNGLGGGGMTLSFGIAAETVGSW